MLRISNSYLNTNIETLVAACVIRNQCNTFSSRTIKNAPFEVDFHVLKDFNYD